MVKSPQEENALEPKESVGVPAVVDGGLGRGHEEPSDMDDLEIPRAKLIQFTSEEAQCEDKDQRKDPGLIINSITKEELGDVFIPIFKFTNFVQWNPRKKEDPNFDHAFEPGEMVFSTDNTRDPRVVNGIKFGENGESPKVTKYLNFLCYFVGHSYPLVLSFSKTSFGAGKRLNSMTQFTGGDMFSSKYKLSVAQKEKSGTKFFALSVAPFEAPTPEEFTACEKFYDELRGKSLSVHSEESEAKAKAGEEGWPEEG